jgi:hypothetical protein
MAKRYKGGIRIGVGYDPMINRPLDERDIVETFNDLLDMDNAYQFITVKVADEDGVAYRWNGLNQSSASNWSLVDTGEGGGGGTGDMNKSVYDQNDNGIVDNAEKLGGSLPSVYDQSAHVADASAHVTPDERDGLDNSPSTINAQNPVASIADIAASGGGDMLKATYDTDDNGIVDNSEKLGGQEPSFYDQSAHVARTDNPHGVDKADVGLGNADNSSDADKPISTATQTALDTKIEGFTAGTGIHIGGSSLSPTISATPQTSAGILSRVYFTGDTEVTSEGTFYTSSDVGKGSVVSVVQSVTVNDNQSDFFTQDVLGSPILINTQLYGGLYAGGLTVSVNEDKAHNRYNVEVYLADANGAPIASGITGEPVGDLGVQVVAIADSGILEFKKDEDTVIDFSVNLTQSLSVMAGQRIRYHFSASKVGTDGGVQQMDIKFGSDHNSYVDTPISLLTSDIINDSSAPGATAFDALSGHETRMVAVENGVGANAVEIITHESRIDNIHQVTAAQTGAVSNDVTGEPSGSDAVVKMVSLTQAEYDAGTPIATTFYVITDA